MRGCITGQTTQVLVGLQKVGLVGLREALRKAQASGLAEREAVVDFIIDALSGENYMPAPSEEQYRLAIWREFQRHRGEDIRDLYSEVEVTVRGAPGEKLDAFVQTLVSVFGEFELKPLVTYAPLSDAEAPPQLLIDDDAVVTGLLPRRAFRNAVRKRISHW